MKNFKLELVYLADLNSIHTVRWINYFAKLKETKVSCISLGESHSNIHRKVKVFKLNGFRNIFNLIRSIFLLRSNKKCIVHVHYLGWNAILVFFINKYKTIILTPWGCDIYANKSNFLKRIFLKFIFKKCDYIICDSYKLIEASTELGANKRNSKVIAFGTDTNEYKKKKIIFSPKGKDKYIKIGTNRCMEPIYDPFTLIKAANYLNKKNKFLKFIIANSGSLEDSLKKYVSKNNLKKTIKFIGPQYGKKNIEFYNSIDIYVSTSLRDGGLSASIAEAMSCERLVIVSNNSENSNYIDHGFTGFLFKNKDFLTLANLIEESLNNIKQSQLIAKKGREVILKKCNYNLEMDKVNVIYKNLLN